MNICIVTVYNSINSGSYLQAFALGEALSRLGHNVCYYKRPNNNGASSSVLLQLKNLTKFILKLKFDKAAAYMHSVSDFRTLTKKFNIITSDMDVYKSIDCVILGSDTIWNLRSKFFYENRNLYWGGIFKGLKVITYAGSVGNTAYEECVKAEGVSDFISGWKHIGVRDKNTFDIISKFTSKSICTVCDPTFLLSEEDYSRLFNIPRINNEEQRFVFLYLFNILSDRQVEELKAFCKKNNLKIVNGTKRVFAPYCDEMAVNSPLSFLKGFMQAQYVITDTFHGTAFSINFRKKFVAMDRNINKVNELLTDFGISDHLIPKDSSFTGQLIKAPSYDKLNSRMESQRINSMEFLKKAIEENQA